jgi:hypothetical protein
MVTTTKKTGKRSRTLGLHDWSNNDTILCLYYTKYGTNGLYLRTEESLANYIGTSSGSLKMQSANIRALMGHTQQSLSDYSQIQANVYNEYGKMSQYELMKVCKSIIGQDEHERNEILKKMGKDPSKMRKI